MSETLKLPKIGDDIYIPSSMSISNGSSDMVGGLATVAGIDKHNMVLVEGFAGKAWSWGYLASQQAELAKRFGNDRAYPDPDIDTPWLEKGDIVNGQKYDGETIW